MASYKDPTVYEGTEVLINKLGIKHKETWLEVERFYANRRLAELKENPIKGKFDYAHLKKIHEYTFQDLYTWAGKERVHNIAKQNQYCFPQYIGENAVKYFDKLKKENYLQNLPQEQFINRATEYMADLYHLHPFREGNTRSLCEFMRELAVNSGYALDYLKVPPERFREALFDSVRGHNEKLQHVLKEIVAPLEKERDRRFQEIREWTGPDKKHSLAASEYVRQANNRYDGKWPGESADHELTAILLSQGFTKHQVADALIKKSPALSDMTADTATKTAKQLVQKVARQPEIKKAMQALSKGLSR